MFIKLFILFLCLNLGMAGVSEVVGINLCDTSNLIKCQSFIPSIYNSTSPNYIVANLTSTSINNTSTNFWDPANWGLIGQLAILGNLIIVAAVQLVTGGFIITMIQHIAGITFTPVWVYGLQVIIGFLVILQIIYWVVGRFASGGQP